MEGTERVNEDILRLEVSMEYFLGVNECDSIENLFDDYFHFLLIDFIVLAGDELLEVLLVVVEHYFQHLLLRFVDHLQEGYDIGVILEGLQQGDLSESAGGNTLFLALEFDVFDCDWLVVFVEGLVDSSEGTLADLAYLLVSLHLPLNSK